MVALRGATFASDAATLEEAFHKCNTLIDFMRLVRDGQHGNGCRPLLDREGQFVGLARIRVLGFDRGHVHDAFPEGGLVAGRPALYFEQMATLWLSRY